MSDYFDMAPTPFNNLMNTANGILSQVPTLTNSALLADSTCTTGRAAVNFCYANNLVARTCFLTSCVCGTIGAVSSGTAIASGFFGIPVAGTLGARAFNRIGKYTLYAGNITNGNFTNTTEIFN